MKKYKWVVSVQYKNFTGIGDFEHNDELVIKAENTDIIKDWVETVYKKDMGIDRITGISIKRMDSMGMIEL